MPILVNANSPQVKQKGGLDKFISLKPDAVLVSYVQSTMGYDTTYVNLQLYDANGTQVFSGTGSRTMGFHKGAIKPILEWILFLFASASTLGRKSRVSIPLSL